uniref:Dolichyl-diphosphooligosaccharide--protein glycosyltransferase subunit 1 n=1 Tax=Alona affinis TaxID=381656 RepID=A0A9N6ZEE9_9CRUS|nr:EOG090X04O4 [Alona affinis]
MRLVLFCILAGLISASVGDSPIVIKSADRTIDVTSQLVKITHRLTLSNTGKSAINSFDFTVDAKSQEHLSYIKAQLADSKESSEGLKTSFSTDKNGVMTCKVSLNVEAGQSAKVLIGSVFTHNLNPHPTEITQKEKQLVQYRGSAYVYSPYKVSHWGNIAVEETLDVYHTGAKLKGSFSRFEYQRESSGVSSVKSFKDDEVVLELRPRFPLFGGWKTHYVIGYNLPTFANLFNSGDEFVLKMNLIDHSFDNMVVDEALVRIILPEGAKNIQLEAPYTVTRLPDELHFTYLDVKGRPVVQLKAKNLVENHIQEFKLRYNFSRVVMLQEPLLCAMAFFVLFSTFIVYARLDFSITKV